MIQLLFSFLMGGLTIREDITIFRELATFPTCRIWGTFVLFNQTQH
jgi:hypothetical protein